MTSDEDARAAARRIVEQVLAGQVEQVLAGQVEQVLAGQDEQVLAGHDEQVFTLADAGGDDAVAGSGEHRLAGAAVPLEDAVAVIRADADVAVEAAPARPVAAARPPVSASATPARVRARELVAAALAEEQEAGAEERSRAEAAARAAAEEAAAAERERQAEERIEAAGRAEEERATTARVRAERLEQERREEAELARVEADRAAAEEDERRRWADADRDVATTTTPMAVHGQPRSSEVAAERGGGDPDATRPVPAELDEHDRTTPLSVAELAASGHTAAPSQPDPDVASAREDRGGQPEHPDADDPGVAEPAATAVLATTTPEPGVTHGEESVEAAPAELVTDPSSTTGVLEATVEPDTFEPRPRTGRWLIASIIGAVTLAIVFPLAIRALLQLVSLS